MGWDQLPNSGLCLPAGLRGSKGNVKSGICDLSSDNNSFGMPAIGLSFQSYVFLKDFIFNSCVWLCVVEHVSIDDHED